MYYHCCTFWLRSVHWHYVSMAFYKISNIYIFLFIIFIMKHHVISVSCSNQENRLFVQLFSISTQRETVIFPLQQSPDLLYSLIPSVVFDINGAFIKKLFHKEPNLSFPKPQKIKTLHRLNQIADEKTKDLYEGFHGVSPSHIPPFPLVYHRISILKRGLICSFFSTKHWESGHGSRRISWTNSRGDKSSAGETFTGEENQQAVWDCLLDNRSMTMLQTR